MHSFRMVLKEVATVATTTTTLLTRQRGAEVEQERPRLERRKRLAFASGATSHGTW